LKTTEFVCRYFAKDTWQISGSACDCYLLIGEKEAVMIDAGSYDENIREFAQTLTEKPVNKVINTHSHFDHTGGNGYFQQIFATEGISRSAKNYMGECRDLSLLDYGFTYVTDGEILPIEGRPLEIIVLNCHSRDNLAVLDRKSRLLFVGDELDAGQVLLLPGYAEQRGQLHAVPAASVETYLGALNRLAQYRDAFDFICTGHNGSPLDPCYLDWFRELCRRILSGEETGSADCSGKTYSPSALHFPFPNAGYRRACWNGISLVYCASRLLDSDPPGTEPATPLHALSAYTIA